MFHKTPPAPKKHVGRWICLLCCAALLVLLFLWEMAVFSLRPYVCSMPSPDGGVKIASGEVFLSTIQISPTQTFPTTFVDVTVTDTVSQEPLSPELCLYDQKDVHVLMSSSWTGPPDAFGETFSDGPILPVSGTTLTSDNIALGTLWSAFPPRNHPTEYTIQYRLFGFFPKTERMVFHWNTGESDVALPSTGPIARLQALFS